MVRSEQTLLMSHRQALRMKELEARIKRLEDKSPQSSSETTDTDEEDDELGMLSAQ